MNLITVEQFKEYNKDLVEEYCKMDKNQLLKEFFNLCTDGINANTRVAFLMENCTDGMSKTTYTLETMKSLIDVKKELDLKEWCASLIEDADLTDNSDEYILQQVKEKAKY